MRIGVALATLFMIIGVVLMFFDGSANTDPTVYNKSITFANIWNSITNFESWGYLTLGIALLIFTPILRVIASIFTFAYEKDLLYVVITFFVLFIIILSFIIGLFLN